VTGWFLKKPKRKTSNKTLENGPIPKTSSRGIVLGFDLEEATVIYN
jgi:hypothetical protein